MKYYNLKLPYCSPDESINRKYRFCFISQVFSTGDEGSAVDVIDNHG